jgi:hypothetical protein
VGGGDFDSNFLTAIEPDRRGLARGVPTKFRRGPEIRRSKAHPENAPICTFVTYVWEGGLADVVLARSFRVYVWDTFLARRRPEGAAWLRLSALNRAGNMGHYPEDVMRKRETFRSTKSSSSVKS